VDGLESLQKQLRELDEAYYHEVDIQNPHRLIRALEVCLTSGKTYSELRTNAKVQRQFDVVSFALDADRNWLYQRINQRVDIMMQQGQEEEARSLYHKRHLNSLNTVGYKELFDFFDGKTSLEDAVSLIKQHTRNYAKRQLTWLRRKQDLKWLRAEEPDLALQTILSILQ
jgi:tRNA dimethylallyltransferase